MLHFAKALIVYVTAISFLVVFAFLLTTFILKIFKVTEKLKDIVQSSNPIFSCIQQLVFATFLSISTFVLKVWRHTLLLYYNISLLKPKYISCVIIIQLSHPRKLTLIQNCLMYSTSSKLSHFP